jgi:hypothetical protein
MKTGIWGIALLALGACGKGGDKHQPAPAKDEAFKLEAKQTPTPPGDGTLEIDVVSVPGAKLSLVYPPDGNSMVVSDGVVADDAGEAHFSIAWPGPPHLQIKVNAYPPQGSSARDVLVDAWNGVVFTYDGMSKIIEARCVAHACHMVVGIGALTFDSIEAGATLEVAGKQVEVASDGTAKATFSDDELLGGLSASKVYPDRFDDRTVPVKLTWKDGTSEQESVGIFGGAAVLWKRLAAVVKGPVALPGDADGPPGTALAVVSTDPKADIFSRIFGVPHSPRDVGLVAVVSPKGAVHRTCGPYGDVRATYKMTIADADVTVYDRATGKQKAHKTFKGGSRNCPKSIEVSTIQASYDDTLTFDMDDVNNWLRPMAK